MKPGPGLSQGRGLARATESGPAPGPEKHSLLRHYSAAAKTLPSHYSGTTRALFSRSQFALRLALFSTQATRIRVRVTLMQALFGH